jgi:hypothetical protein
MAILAGGAASGRGPAQADGIARALITKQYEVR